MVVDKEIHGPKPVGPGRSGSVLVLGELDRTRTDKNSKTSDRTRINKNFQISGWTRAHKTLKVSDQNLAVRGSHRFDVYLLGTWIKLRQTIL